MALLSKIIFDSGIVIISAIGKVLFKQELDFRAIIGIGFILVGILVIQLFSKTAS